MFWMRQFHQGALDVKKGVLERQLTKARCICDRKRCQELTDEISGIEAEEMEEMELALGEPPAKRHKPTSPEGRAAIIQSRAETAEALAKAQAEYESEAQAEYESAVPAKPGRPLGRAKGQAKSKANGKAKF